ncbi:hypothetical protein [Tardiphaga sp.]|uniref:hypothetical protein n=1 Tax=Tardiphaga sp. TaxID=1926292 RepID=UPI00262ABD5C|nr:hypothetical protein [Tardiphaga sp.]MDB5616633.1 hypothetical protein [Tardiphaga sp.]
MTQNDPTDHALAAIASILDHSTEKPDSKAELTPAPHHEVESPASVPEPSPPEIDIDTYSRLGPGPLDAIRFRWTARRDTDGLFFVDETIGPHSRPLALGPMPRREVIGFIDSREVGARRRFDALKNEMTFSKRVPDYDSAADDES